MTIALQPPRIGFISMLTYAQVILIAFGSSVFLNSQVWINEALLIKHIQQQLVLIPHREKFSFDGACKIGLYVKEFLQTSTYKAK